MAHRVSLGPGAIVGHSMIQYDVKSIYIIGGNQDQNVHSTFRSECSNKTWIADPADVVSMTKLTTMKEGPSLNKGRRYHGCAKMTINGRTILVVAGGVGKGEAVGYVAMDSVEILDPSENNVWIPGLCLKSAYYCIELCFNKLTIFQDQIFQWD